MGARLSSKFGSNDTSSYSPLQINEDDISEHTKQRCCSKRICRGHIAIWHLILIILAIIIASILVLYFTLVPKIIQNVINKSQLEFNYLQMQQITNSTITIFARGGLTNTGPFSAKISQSNTFSVYYQNMELGQMDIPSISVEKDAAETPVTCDNTIVTITNFSLIMQYGMDLLNTGEADWELVGNVDVTVFNIFTFKKFPFRKSLAIPGMDGLNNVTVEGFNLLGDSLDKEQIYLTLNATIENPSLVQMAIGDIQFASIFQNQTIGTLVASNVALVNGTNFLTMSGYLEAPTSEALAAIETFFNNYISGVDSLVSVRGLGGSATTPEWFNATLQTMHMTTTILGAQNLSLITGMTLEGLSMELPGLPGIPTDSGIVTLASNVQAGFKPPFPITLDIYEVSIVANMTVNGKVLATLPTTEYYPVYTNESAELLLFNLSSADMRIVDREGFTNLVTSLMLSSGEGFALSGISNARVSTAVGDILLSNITIPKLYMKLEGFNSFANALVIEQPNNHITNGFEWGMNLWLSTLITNPSALSIKLDSLSFDLYYEGMYMGNTTVMDVSLGPGENTVICNATYLKPKNQNLERQFFSKYLQGNDTIVNLIGNTNNIPLLLPAMKKLNISVVFPGQKQDIVAWVDLGSILPPATAALAIFNPIDCDVSVLSLIGYNIYKTDWTYFTTVDDTVFDPYFEVGVHDVRLTEEVELALTWEEFLSIFEGYTKGNHTLLSVGTAAFKVGDYGPILVDLQQNFTLVGDQS